MAGKKLGRVSPRNVDALKLLPATLLADVLHEAYMPTLVLHPLFVVQRRLDPESCTMLTSQAVQPFVLRAGDELSDPLDGLIFVVTGRLGYFMSSSTECIAVPPGRWCCEEALWCRFPSLNGHLEPL